MVGCNFNWPTPSGARIRCGAEGACPRGWVCQGSSGYCVEVGGGEGAELDGTARLTPSAGKMDTVFTLEFRVAGTLLVEPVATLVLRGQNTGRFTRVGSGSDPFTYAFRAADTGPGPVLASWEGIHHVELELIGSNGATQNVSVGDLELDFTPPTASGAVVRFFPQPDAGLPVDRVSALGAGTTAEVSFQIDEALGPPPQLFAQPNPQAVVFAPASVAGRLVTTTVNAAPGSSLSQDLTLAVRLEDAVGNVSTSALSEPLAVDTLPPPAPDTATPDSIIYRRAPWGTLTGGRFAALVGGSSALAEGGTLIVYDSDSGGIELDRFSLPAGAFPEQRLRSVVAPRVWVALVDRAGNSSSVVPVRDVEWFAAFSGPGAPFRGAQRPVTSEGLLQPDELLLSTLPSTVTGAWTWKQVALGPPNAFIGLAGAFDSARGNLVAFGGTGAVSDGGFATLSETWEWDGEQWALRPTGQTPLPLAGLAAAWDARLRQVVVFDDSATTWLWDGQRWAKAATATAPPGRRYAAMAYDPLRQRTVLYGGFCGQGIPTPCPVDTWEFDGQNWALTADAGPEFNVAAPSMAYDRASRRMMLSGFGVPVSPSTWVLGSGRWEPTDAGDIPGFAKMVWDTARDRLLLTNGDGISEWNGADWVALDAGPGPGPSPDALVAWDTIRQQLVFLGGPNAERNTWSWAGGGWKQVGQPEPTPPARARHGLAFDSASGETVMQGGDPGVSGFSPSWAWNGQRWRQLGTGLPALKGGVMVALDAGVDGGWPTLVYFGGEGDGGYSSQTYLFRGGAWSGQTFSPSPSGRTGAAAAALGGRLLLRGGVDAISEGGGTSLGDTWVFNPNPASLGWAQVGSLSFERSLAGAASEPDSGSVILFGGAQFIERDIPSGTYRWDGAGWPTVGTALRPIDRVLPGMSTDLDRGTVVLFGGRRHQDTWEWKGGGWSQAQVTDPEGDGIPEARGSPLSFDPLRRRHLLFSGERTADVYDPRPDTWELEVYRRAPALVFRVATADAAFPKGSVSRLSVRAIAGADAQNPLTGGAISGARLATWLKGRFGGPTISNSAPASAATLLEIVPTESAQISGLLEEGEAELGIEVLPLGVNGRGLAQVRVEALEVGLKFRLP